MFRNNVEGTNDNYLSGLNIMGLTLPEVYTGDATAMGPIRPMTLQPPPPPPPVSSSGSLSPPSTPLTPEPSSPHHHFGFPTPQFPALSEGIHMNMNANMLSAALNAASVQQSGGGGGGLAAAPINANAMHHSSMLLQRQYNYHLLLQQQQQLMLAQQQLALAASAANVNHQQKDEIAHSLKMFAFLTACNADNGNGGTQDVMQDFAANGYASDDLNRYQNNNQQHVAAAPPPQPHLAGAAAGASSPLAHVQWMNLNNYREQLNNVWRNLSYTQVPNMALNAGLIANNLANNNATNAFGLGMNLVTDQVHNINNISTATAATITTNSTNNNNNTRLNKRSNGSNGKSKEFTRHCVFCENNNEAEAVVNSHSVRDNLGRVLCPRLRVYVCPICKASGDSAHTIKYCPKKPIITMEDAINAESFRLAKSTFYKPQQMKV